MNQKLTIKPSATTFPVQEPERLPELTQRQQQILALIKAGKVNKEIANELGIGLGTVKQHVVALFKKLHVSNRTMAASQGLDQAPVAHLESAEISEGMLERRPCIVLSIFLSDAILKNATEPSARNIVQEQLHKTFSALAGTYHALFLTSKHCVGDLIFGIQRGTEQDIFKALRAARAIFDALTDYPSLTQDLRGGLAAGFAISTMNRHGGWSGEVVASAVIAQARELAGNAAPGELALGALAKTLLEITGPCAPGFAIPQLLFKTLNRMPWGNNHQLPQSQAGGSEEPGSEPPILGRDTELERLEILFSDVFKGKKNHLVYIEGETGMGKSLLCRYAAEHALNMKGRVHHFVCHSGGEEGNLYMFPSGAPVKPQALLHCLKSVVGRGYEVIIVDDAHLLPANILLKATETASAAKGKLVIIAARKFSKYVVAPSETIKLGHLPKTAIENLIAQSVAQLEKDQLKAAEGRADSTIQHAQDTHCTTATIAQLALGVPLFAIELAHHHQDDSLPFSLHVVINARMDGLKLDRALLRYISKATIHLTAAEIAKAMWESPDVIQQAAEQACASGVLWLDEEGRLGFVHPLLRILVKQSGVE